MAFFFFFATCATRIVGGNNYVSNQYLSNTYACYICNYSRSSNGDNYIYKRSGTAQGKLP